MRATFEFRDMRVRSDFSSWLLAQGVTRPENGPCPACGSAAWCVEPCPLLDPMDWR